MRRFDYLAMGAIAFMVTLGILALFSNASAIAYGQNLPIVPQDALYVWSDPNDGMEVEAMYALAPPDACAVSISRRVITIRFSDACEEP